VRCLRLLLALVAAGAALATVGQARADEITFRGNYWRDRNTRILQPEVDITKELPSGTILGAHYLLDTITSASIAAGALRDELFTELRNEVGVRVGQRIGRATLTGSYSYSSESDYQASLASLSATMDLAQKTTTLGFALAYGHDNVARRMGPTAYTPLGSLDTLTFIASVNQIFSPTVSAALSYDFGVIGFGDPSNGFQANPYRPVNVGSSPTRENVPFQRFRNAAAGSLSWLVPLRSRVVPWVMFRPAYRFYFDDWGVRSHTPELRVYVPTGIFEWRVTGRWYTQTAASFWSSLSDDIPFYPGQGKACTTCWGGSTEGGLFYTSDPKLSEFRTFFIEARLLMRLRFLQKLSRPLSNGFVELSYGHLFTERHVNRTFGDGHVAGLTLQWPL
jgi:hypothetical protein